MGGKCVWVNEASLALFNVHRGRRHSCLCQYCGCAAVALVVLACWACCKGFYPVWFGEPDPVYNYNDVVPAGAPVDPPGNASRMWTAPHIQTRQPLS